MTGNTLFRIVIAAAALILMPLLVRLQERTLPLADFVIWFHVGFNLCVCVVMLPFVNLFSKLVLALIPDDRTEPPQDAPRHLDRSAPMSIPSSRSPTPRARSCAWATAP